MKRLAARRTRGFTLLEVLVALAILSLVMIVLGQTLGSAIGAYGHLDMKTRAWLVASDKMVEMQVYARWPGIGTQKEKVDRDGESWQVTTQVTKGPFAGTRRVDISVTLQQDQNKGGSLYTLSGLLGEPVQAPVKQQQSNDSSNNSSSNNSSSNNASTNSAANNASASANNHSSSWKHP